MTSENGLRTETDTVKRVNRFILIIITIIDTFLFFGYIGDYKQGNISFNFMLMVVISVVVSMAVCYITYFRKKDSRLFKHISMAGYVIVYGMAVFGGILYIQYNLH